MDIAVTTPTGNVGREVVGMLIRAGLRPRVLVRNPKRLAPEIRDHVTAVVADQADPDAVAAATAGVGALFWVNPPTFDADDPFAASEHFGKVAARAIASNGISRTVFQSSMGAELRHGVGDIDGLARTEELLEAAGANVLHLRCGYFFTNLLLAIDDLHRGMLSVIAPLDQPTPWVAPRDIAEVAVARLLSTTWTGRQVQAVHGPEDLTWRGVAAIVTAATGHDVDVQRIPDASMHDGLAAAGLNETQIDAVMGMSTGLRDGYTPEQPRDVTTTTPTTLGAWAYGLLRPTLQQSPQPTAKKLST